MATQVYLSGKNIIVNKSGGGSLTIPVSRCKYTYVGTYPVSTIYDYDEVIFWDLGTEESITDDIVEVQNSVPAYIGDQYQTKAYLDGFIPLSDAKLNIVDTKSDASVGDFTVVNITSIDSPYPTKNKEAVMCDTSGGNIIVNLPLGGKNYEITIKKTDTTPLSTVTINGQSGELIDGTANITLTGVTQPSVTLIFDGSIWNII